jgi:DNA-binding winged helix-turn-helix (wHTH) protein
LPAASFVVGEWLVEPDLNQVSRNGVSAHVRPQLIDLLVYLARNTGRTVPHGELLANVWPGQPFVTGTALPRCIAELRQTLGDRASGSTVIETIPKRGYRLIAAVGPAADVRPPARADAARPPQFQPDTQPQPESALPPESELQPAPALALTPVPELAPTSVPALTSAPALTPAPALALTSAPALTPALALTPVPALAPTSVPALTSASAPASMEHPGEAPASGSTAAPATASPSPRGAEASGDPRPDRQVLAWLLRARQLAAHAWRPFRSRAG